MGRGHKKVWLGGILAFGIMQSDGAKLVASGGNARGCTWKDKHV